MAVSYRVVVSFIRMQELAFFQDESHLAISCSHFQPQEVPGSRLSVLMASWSTFREGHFSALRTCPWPVGPALCRISLPPAPPVVVLAPVGCSGPDR